MFEQFHSSWTQIFSSYVLLVTWLSILHNTYVYCVFRRVTRTTFFFSAKSLGILPKNTFVETAFFRSNPKLHIHKNWSFFLTFVRIIIEIYFMYMLVCKVMPKYLRIIRFMDTNFFIYLYFPTSQSFRVKISY